jgi:predicted ATP-binding protein involved in virulence
MHLKKITLRNFRCFGELEVSLHPRLTVLVAENGGGKTSVLDGIALGFAPVLRSLSTANQRLNSPGIEDTDFQTKTTPDGSRELRADFVQLVMETTEGLRWDVWKPGMAGAKPEETIGQGDLHFLTEVLESFKTSHPKMLPVFAYYGARRGWIEIPQRLRDNKKKAVDYTYPTSALFGCLDALTDFKEMMKWFDGEEASEIRRQRDSEDNEESLTLRSVRSTIPKVLGKSFYNPHFDGRHKFVIRSHSDPKKLQVSQLSQGYQSMLALVMDFSRRLALANPHLNHGGQGLEQMGMVAMAYYEKWHVLDEDDCLEMLMAGPILAPAVMLVDEVDLHLHPSWQQRVLDDLMEAFPHTQFIVTTHSPQVLTTVKGESIRILSQSPEGKWSALPASEQTKGDESATVLATVMGVDPVPQVPEAEDLRRYRHLIETQQHDTPQARNLRQRLEDHFGPQHHLMLDCDRMIRLAQFKAKLPIHANPV